MRIFDGFRDPARRPRYIIWTGVAAIIFVLLWAFAMVGTSFAWFCEEPCHIVHLDNTKAYNASTHSKVSCIACHEPVNADPGTFTYLKIFVLDDLFATVTGTFDLPMNPYNEVALAMPAKQCTQCHDLSTRTISPSGGVKINHAIHTKNDVKCTLCHNRVAHNDEAVEYTLPGDTKHEDWMTMDGCFRCHSQAPDAKAPGTCAACHPPEYKLVPASHDAKTWYTPFGDSTGHSKAAKNESASVAAAPKHTEDVEAEEKQDAEPTLPPASAVNSCYTCHKSAFCNDCHGGVVLPHPAAFKKSHGAQGYANPEVCGRCHARSAAEAKEIGFCNACHHPASTPNQPWLTTHPRIVSDKGAEPCFSCHDERQCSYCHVNGTAAGRAELKLMGTE